MTTMKEQTRTGSLTSIHEKDRETVSRWLLEKKASGLSENTIRAYYATARVLSTLSPKPLLECTREDVLGIIVDVQKAYEDPAIYKQVLVDILRRSGRQDVVSDVRLRHRKKARQDPATILDPKDVLRLLSATSDPRDRAIVALFWDAGARNHEIASIQIGDIQPFEKKIHGHIYLSVYFRKQKVRGEERRIPLVFSSEHLERWLKEHPDGDNPQASLFVSRRRFNWPPLSTQRLRDIVRVLGKKAGIRKPCHPHAFRHARATDLKRKGTSDEAIKTWMGWTPGSTMTNRYVSRREDEKIDEVVENLTPEDLVPPVTFKEIPTTTVGEAKLLTDQVGEVLKKMGTMDETFKEFKQKIARLETQNLSSQS